MKTTRVILAVPLAIVLVGLVTPPFACVAEVSEAMTPLLLAVQDPPVPFVGSDARVHLVYELEMTNYSSAEIKVEKVEVTVEGGVLQTLDQAAVAARLQPAGMRDSTSTLIKSTKALLFLDVVLAPGSQIPSELSHTITMYIGAAPPGSQDYKENGGATKVDKQSVVLIGPPLHGERYISADSCCDATRHTRAALPINGRVWLAQRYAVDWEQLDEQGHIYSGPREQLKSYAIFGQPVFAVADARVVSVIDGQPEQTPGKYPTNISLAAADGNSIILDLGEQRYALYAHLQPGSIKVRVGEQVALGQMIGLVGDTGNSIVPHLHFQVMGAPSSLASNGLPYEINDFEVTGKTPGTSGFDEAESNGTVLAVTPFSPPQVIKQAMPLDQLIISLRAH